MVDKEVGLAFARLYFLSNTEFLSISIPFSFGKEKLIRAINPHFGVNSLPLPSGQYQQQGTLL